MLLVLGLALVPLGLLALLASIDAARDGRAAREAQARTFARDAAVRLDRAVGRDILALKLALAVADVTADRSAACRLLDRARGLDGTLLLGHHTVIARDGVPACTHGPSIAPPPFHAADGRSRVSLDVPGRTLRFAVAVDDLLGVGALDVAALRSAALGGEGPGGVDLELQQDRRRLSILQGKERLGLQETIAHRARLQDSNVLVVALAGAMPISAVEIASILLPLLMWLAAALLGWLIVDRLLLRPIVRMQQAVLSYSPGGPAISIPDPVTPATEIRDLGQAFARVTTTVALHEAELEAAIARQARLVREVHHRVKNNLQVVASLLNLHARGARSREASNAYATIQRRVDALSVVHRNHFAELESNRGVALRPLLSELTGNLRATAPDEASGMAITLELDPVYVNQDVAVSVSFFVTEVVEHAMLCTPDQPVEVVLRQSSPATARLVLASASLREDVDCSGTDIRQFERITIGLSRQLRAVLEQDRTAGRFGIDISTYTDEMST